MPAFQEQHFARLKCIVLPPQEEKCHFSFSLIERHFFMQFYVPFHFFKVRFDFACLPRAPFGKAKAHRGTQKCHFFSSLIERHFFVHVYVLFHFFKVPFDFAPLPKAAFWKDKAHRGTPKGAKMSFFFSLIERHFFMHFCDIIIIPSRSL